MSVPAMYDVYASGIEWYTPEKYIKAVREVFGGYIDLDPASCELANLVVQAGTIYTAKDNGLHCPWYGKVFCNPPYGKTGNDSHQSAWSGRMIHEYREGHILEGILLTSSTDTATKWYQRLMYYPHCKTDHRIPFYHYEAGKRRRHDRAMGGSLFTYFGKNPERFYEVFHQFGSVFYPAISFENSQKVMQF